MEKSNSRSSSIASKRSRAMMLPQQPQKFPRYLWILAQGSNARNLLVRTIAISTYLALFHDKISRFKSLRAKLMCSVPTVIDSVVQEFLITPRNSVVATDDPRDSELSYDTDSDKELSISSGGSPSSSTTDVSGLMDLDSVSPRKDNITSVPKLESPKGKDLLHGHK
jgi:hypothetical protein